MQLKMDGNGNVVVQNGHPVYVDSEGRDIPVDVPGMYTKISALNNESASRRRELTDLKQKFSAFDGIEDPVQFVTSAKEAMEIAQGIKDKTLLDSGKVDELKATIKASYEDKIRNMTETFNNQINDHNKLVSKKDNQIYSLMVSSKFAASPFFSGEKPTTVLIPEIAESYFGKHFKVEENDGNLRIIGYLDENIIYSRTNPGEPASFDEAIAEIIDRYPMKDRILRAGNSGSGSRGNSGSGYGDNELDRLKKEYDKAVQSGDMVGAIAIKNEIHKVQLKA